MDHGSKSGTPCEAQTQPHAPVPERAHAHSHAQTQVQEQAEGFASGAAPTTWLVYGGTSGWIGQKMVQLVRARPQCRAVCASARIECREQVEACALVLAFLASFFVTFFLFLSFYSLSCFLSCFVIRA
eukprot:TRINITY_DN5674_c0_g1_i2.p2 TRINITY_DN5674_c0_g1~~TRINITY_DN5674_c0_g1_i2.p2  ORF type:complete len:128 (-),score=16.63 TRINITY_DN5674_c0_g1_i2:91-474(-)